MIDTGSPAHRRLIGSASMYEWTDSLRRAWRRLLHQVAARAGVALEIPPGDAPSAPEETASAHELACVMVCGYPWARLPADRDRPVLLAAPVPSPARYGDQPVYFADFIVRADRRYESLEDTFGGRLAYSAEESHSGYNAARHHLVAYRTPSRPKLYREVKGPYLRQRAVIQAVLDGEADVGPVDSYALDLLRRHEPLTTSRLRVVATTAPAPSPPLVASPAIDEAARDRITRALLAAHEAPQMKPTLEALLIARFARVDPAAFELFLDWEAAAERAGYGRLV